MNWIKKDRIYKANKKNYWSISHAQIPSALRLDDQILRIFFGTRDICNRTVTAFIDVEADSPGEIINEGKKPALDLGDIGSFDDCGAMPSWPIKKDGIVYMFYTGWNLSTTVPYRNSIGLAISEDNGVSFKKPYPGPILDRSPYEPFFCATPCVIIENKIWRMWYLSCVKWKIYKDRAEPSYNIKYAESKDGITWYREGITCIDFKSIDEGAIARPSVLKENGIYKMWYSKRSIIDYRKITRKSYKIGYAESNDGIKWKRLDNEAGIEVSDSGWDSEMTAYPFVYMHKKQKYLLYNGNGFGRSGFGYAILEK